MRHNHILREAAQRCPDVRLCRCVQCNEPIVVAWVTDSALAPPPPLLVDLAAEADIPAYVISPIDDETAYIRKVGPAGPVSTATIRQFVQIIAGHRARHTCPGAMAKERALGATFAAP